MPKDGTINRERILDAAERLVIENGFAATSLDRVIAASATSKGAFFHHFTSKADLARALVERYAAADVAHLDAALEHAAATTDDPAGRVLAFLRVFEDGADDLMAAQSGCLYISVLTERQLADQGTSGPILDAIVAWRIAFSRLLREALPPSSPVEPDALADHLFATFEGAFLLCRSTGDPSHMRAQLTVFRQLVESLLRPDGSPAGEVTAGSRRRG